MDCTEFRRHHLAYVDDTLPGDVLVAAERHRVECAACGAQDTLVRRSLLLARNLPTIEPSADFAARLEARLCAVRAEGGADDRDIGRIDDGEYRGAYGRAYDADGGPAWYARLAREAGGWGRQATAAAVVCAAVSAGYALRAREGAAPAAGAAASPAAAVSAGEAGASGGGTVGTPAPAATLLGEASAGAAPFESLGTTTAAAAGVASRAFHAARRRAGVRATAALGGDDLGLPAYIPLPAGALEAAALLGSTSAGVPVWPAALLAGEAPGQLRSAAPGRPIVRLVGLTH